MASKDTPIIIIGAAVYDVCYEELIKGGFNVINYEKIPLPTYRSRITFWKKLSALLKKYGWYRSEI